MSLKRHQGLQRRILAIFLYTASTLFAVGGSGCTTLPWGNGGLGDELPATAIDPRGLVRVLGSGDITAAAARLTNQLPGEWGDVIVLGGEVDLYAGAASIRAGLDGLEVWPGPVQLGWSADGLEARIGVTLGSDAAPEGNGPGGPCWPAVTADDATLTLAIGLGTDKLGRVQAALRESPELTGDYRAVTWGACLDADMGAVSGLLEEALWDALAEAVADAVAPALLDALPQSLGLDLATGLAGTVAQDAVGAGFARLSVEAVAAEGEDVWQALGGELRAVPFTVGITAERHPCMPALSLPATGETGLPGFGAATGGVALVGAHVVRRAVTAAWLAGAVCGEHASGGIAVAAGELAPAWPVLARLPATAPLTVAVWPRELPSVGLALRGADRLTIATGVVDVDVFAELDGATVRLASLTLVAETDAAVMVGASGLVSLAPEEVRLVASGARAGLFEAPPLAVAEAVMGPIVTALLEGRAVLKLPARPSTSTTTRARVTAEHVAIPM